MNGPINTKKIFNHWINTSDSDFKTMMNLFESKDYHWSLFIGHIVLEKLLKAFVVSYTREHAPFTHDLVKLAKLTEIELSTEYLDWLDTITTFNLNARYDSYKKAFYEKCTHEYTTEWINKIKILRKWIKEAQ